MRRRALARCCAGSRGRGCARVPALGSQKPEQRLDQRGLARPRSAPAIPTAFRCRKRRDGRRSRAGSPAVQLHLRFFESTTASCPSFYCDPTSPCSGASISIASRINPETRATARRGGSVPVFHRTPRESDRVRPRARERRARVSGDRMPSCALRVQPAEGGRVESGRRRELAEELRRPDEREPPFRSRWHAPRRRDRRPPPCSPIVRPVMPSGSPPGLIVLHVRPPALSCSNTIRLACSSGPSSALNVSTSFWRELSMTAGCSPRSP
jgi:hypothetical protein